MRAIVHALFWLTLSCWIAMVVAPGLTGMTAFTVLRDQQVSVPTYAPFFVDDPEGMSRLAAGLVTDPIFRITSMIQWVLAPLTVVLCIIEFRPLRLLPGWAQAIRLPLLALGLGLVIHHNVNSRPSFPLGLCTAEAKTIAQVLYISEYVIQKRLLELKKVSAHAAQSHATMPRPYRY